MKKKEFLKRINDGIERGSKRKLAKILNIDPANVTQWFLGKSNPSEQMVQKMSGLFSIDEQELWDMFNGKYDEEPTTKKQSEEFVQKLNVTPLTDRNTIQLPILADVPAGLPEYSDRDVEIFKDIPRDMFPGADFVIRCIGDSLSPKIEVGDFCVIRKMDEAINGRPMLVETETGYCMKVIKKTEKGTQLFSINKKYKPFYPKKCRIVGLIIGIWARTDKENLLELA